MVSVSIEGESIIVPSGILEAASPVFASMLTGGMKETIEQAICLPGKRKRDFEDVLGFLRPGSSRTMQINEKNVDYLLQWFDEYQMLDLKSECEEFLLTLPCSFDRLLQAKQHGLQKQCARCLQEVARNFENEPIEAIVEASPDVLRQLLLVMQQCQRERAAKAQELEAQVRDLPSVLFYSLPKGCRPDERIDGLAKIKLQDVVAQIKFR
mmetsp:Transcript_26466/g.85595  ORF Transcript_26466/g.85595 Transcript_26466/m.85595 type:complete len:210 (-) Transcript_26466:179-808(-)